MGIQIRNRMTRYPRFGSLLILFPLIFLFLFQIANSRKATAHTAPAPLAMENLRADVKQTAVKGQLIVKFKDSVTSCVHCLINNRRRFRSATTNGDDSLDVFHTNYEIISARPVFRTVEEERHALGSEVTAKSLKESYRQEVNLAKAKFPLRWQRIPKNASVPDLHHIYILQFSEDANLEGALPELQRNPHVEYAQPNYFANIHFVPNDPFYRSSGSWGQNYDDLWGIKEDKLDLALAWDVTQGEGVVVAVVDTGLDYNHPDIAANVWVNPGEIAGNRRDDDGNGFADDIRGWDFVTCQNLGGGVCVSPKEPDSNPIDDNGHGTHVSGTIAAVGNNKRGIIGVAPRAKIMPVKAFNREGVAPHSESSAGLVYAALNGADVINNSWGCGFCPSNPVVEDAVRLAHGLGAVVVFSAGNDSRDVRTKSPQNMRRPKPVVISASNQLDQPTYFTSFGATIDVAAPGGGDVSTPSNILSLKSKECRVCAKKRILNSEYLRLAGTSMSAPHASGLAALVLAKRPALTNEEVRHVLRTSTEDIDLRGFDLKTGAGRLNAPRALAIPSVLSVKIEKPLHASATTQPSVTIRGTAAGPNFEQYQLFYSCDTNTEWKPIGGPVTRSVQNSTLGNWPLGSLPLGWKLLRLVATMRNGLTFEDVIDFGTQLPFNRIIHDPIDESREPHISGDRIVWATDVKSGRGSHLFLYDFSTRTKKQITTKPFPVYSIPRISGNVIAWTIEYTDNSRDEIYFCTYDPKSGKCPAQGFTVGQFILGFALSGNKIVWSEQTPPDPPERVFVYDIATKTKKLIGFGFHPDISGDLVVWAKVNSDSTGDLFLYDFKTNTTRQITNDPDVEIEPKISDRRVAFNRIHRTIQNGEVLDERRELYVFDMDTGMERLLVFDVFRGFEFSGNHIVWSNRSHDISLYDLQTDTEHGLAISPLGCRFTPTVSGNRVAWQFITPERCAVSSNGEIHYTVIPKE